MSNKIFVRAIEGTKKTVIYFTKEGHRYEYSGGTWAWRNNNPGNMHVGKVTKRNGYIGKAGGFAIFSSYEQGHVALIDLLKNEYSNLSLEKMIERYAPPNENKTEKYLMYLIKKIGVKDRKLKLKELTPKQFDKLWQSIETMEGAKSGKIRALPPLKQITKILKNKKNTIVAYFVVKMGWIEKDQAISLTKKWEIDAVVATSRNGNLYLRTRPDVKVENNLNVLG